MRIPMIVGNWKMNKTADSVESFVNGIRGNLPNAMQLETAICAPALFLEQMVDQTRDMPLEVGAENCYFEDNGPFTGETSPYALSKAGVDFVILGHSERRKIFRETDEMINLKVQAVFRNHMRPIICCDETMGQRESNDAVHWVVAQVIEALKGVDEEQAGTAIIAYEPSWAIGVGTPASPDQIEEGCYLIRQTVADVYDDEIADEVRVLYGGSVKPANINTIMQKQDVDGVLVGNASLQPESFLELISNDPGK
ncbi:MAG: triose-phosphate isomerase [Furfurilactobacillus sp.]|jgi:triosephosphate isomerase|uniref:Triosephosphate isomerase n=1 Tax=Furfurilactobacillus milii TaxID=2888272 RepID=A0ABT6DAM4_9LACO|nr:MULTISPECIES: triose-phosphate isomerase [Furfurilactobacillus]QLE67048.1 Triosephosphate isomerase [Furfurilactobacillus rossiae]MCF6161307.1 triose-phosphate isomerase [Furfurilactobacillus milii]MCF6163687.1 triose-phosphate isomerase [Furfurilactobacillus milii]MCF6418942.1 triose-phosphate isomerase [Furfurilactobacillus milii]MCH4011246.1 triose-phosphate isomerase [Furfurilactobacillus sp.]